MARHRSHSVAFKRQVAQEYLSGETLHGAIQEPLDKIRLGLIKPQTVTLRLLLPDTSRPMVLPCRVEDLSDDPDYRARMHQLTSRHAYAIVDLLQELTRLGLISEASTQIRAHPAPPMFKLYILNGEEVFLACTRSSSTTSRSPTAPVTSTT